MIKALFFLFFITTAFALDVNLKTQVDKALATTKDTFTFTIEITYPENLDLDLPEVGDKIQGLRIVSFGTSPKTIDDGRVAKSRWYKLQADVSGSYILPGIELNYLDKKSKQQKTVKSAEIFIEITSDFSKEKDHKDIKEIKPIYTTSYLIRYLLVGLALLLIIGLIYFIWQKKRYKELKTVPTEPYDVICLRQLKAMKIEGQNNKKAKENYFFLSEVLKNIFEYRFGFPATDLTLDEAKKKLQRSVTISSENKTIFLDLLSRMEMVKFANSEPEEKDLFYIQDALIKFVRSTKPKTEEGDKC